MLTLLIVVAVLVGLTAFGWRGRRRRPLNPRFAEALRERREVDEAAIDRHTWQGGGGG